MGENEGKPAPAQGDERRRHVRAAVGLVVQLEFGSVREFLSAHGQDLSMGGMFLRAPASVPGGNLGEVGQILRLQFDAGDQRIVHGTGKVVRVVQGGAPGQAPGVGIEFLELDAQSRALIAAIVEIRSAEPFDL